VSTGLTNIPSENTGITSNQLAANTDFTFPAARWTGIGKADSPFRYTVILSPFPIKELKFLNDAPVRALTADERLSLDGFRERHSNKSVETKRDGSFAIVTSRTESTDMLIFDILVNPY